MNITLIAD